MISIVEAFIAKKQHSREIKIIRRAGSYKNG
jgi:hypothetical protein